PASREDCAGSTSTSITSTRVAGSWPTTAGSGGGRAMTSSWSPISATAATTTTSSACRAAGGGGCASTATGRGTAACSVGPSAATATLCRDDMTRCRSTARSPSGRTPCSSSLRTADGPAPGPKIVYGTVFRGHHTYLRIPELYSGDIIPISGPAQVL